ncbi:MAG: DNA polymerase III subunit delta' [Bacteroidota bacterium]
MLSDAPEPAWPRVLGQERVKALLGSALRSGRLAHSYLFHGPEGVGKDAMALELGRVLHCAGGTMEACGECPSCIALDTMQHPDILLVTALPVGRNEESWDPPLEKLTPPDLAAVQEEYRRKGANPYHRVAVPRATVIKINSIREIRRQASLSTLDGKRRVVIISHAEEMGAEAENTLLKTLEEPFARTMLILTTAHRDALLPTIISRCQTVRFDPIPDLVIARALGERTPLNPAEALLLARLSGGSFARALELTEEDVARLRNEVAPFVRAVLWTDIPGLVRLIEGLSGGRDRRKVARFLEFLLAWFRDALVLSHGGAILSGDQEEDLKKFVENFGGADLAGIIPEVERAIFLLERNVYIKLVLLHLSVRLRRLLMPHRRGGTTHP